jgi:hypothetical protein
MLLLVPAAVGARIALTPWLASEAREALSRVPGHDVRFARLGVSLFPPTIAIRGVEVHRAEGASHTRLLTAARVDVEIPWRELVKRERRVNVTVASPRYLAGAEGGLDLAALVAPLPRATIDLLVVHDGRVEVPNAAGGATPILLDVDAQGKGLDTHGGGAAARVEGSAGLLRSGQLHFSFDVAQGAKPGRVALDLRGLALGDLEALVGRTPAQAWGALEASTRLAARGPNLEGRLSARTSLSQTGAEPQALASALDAGLARLAPGVALQVAPGAEGSLDERGAAVTGTVAPPGLGFVDGALGLVRATLVRGVELALRPGADAPAPQDAVAVE